MSDRIRAAWRTTYEVTRAAAAAAGEHGVPTLAAALSYWMLVTIAPLIAVVSAVTQLLGVAEPQLSPEAVAGAPVSPMDIAGRAVTWAGPYGSAIALIVVFYGATALFGQFARAITRIWGGPDDHRPVWEWLRAHLLGMALLVGALVAVVGSTAMGTIVSRATSIAQARVEELGLHTVPVTGDLERLLISWAASALLFGIAYLVVPFRRPSVRDVVPGALVTGLAFMVGQKGLSLYLASTTRFDVLGVFGVFIAFMVWVYYTALIVLYGAELTHEVALMKAARRD